MEPSDLKVSEMFYSLQGEGMRAGQPSLFVRLQGCSAKHACYASGIRCDTEFESGAPVPVSGLAGRLLALSSECKWIIWTGGEPLDQLTPEHLRFFAGLGYQQALETSGVRPMSAELVELFDWICLSPKVAEHVLAKNFLHTAVIGKTEGETVHVHEMRYVRHVGQDVPHPALMSLVRCLSPHCDGQEVNAANLKHCIDLCLAHPEWQLSVQQHKIWKVL